MPKKVEILISAVIVTILATVGGITMVIAGAEGEEEETTPPAEESSKGLLERVADILEIDKEDLIDAFKQAHQEMREDAFIKHLNQAVEEGHISQEQADKIIKWWEQRPEVIKPTLFRHALRFFASRRAHLWNDFRGWQDPRPPR